MGSHNIDCEAIIGVLNVLNNSGTGGSLIVGCQPGTTKGSRWETFSLISTESRTKLLLLSYIYIKSDKKKFDYLFFEPNFFSFFAKKYLSSFILNNIILIILK